MKYPIEENMPYLWLALLVLVIFYGIYFAKMLAQRKRKISTYSRAVDEYCDTCRSCYSDIIHYIWLESHACKCKIYRILYRNAW